MTDRLTLTRALEGGGLTSAAAEHIATEIYDAIRDNVATKADLRELEQRLNARFDLVEERLRHMATKAWVAAQTFVLLGGIAALIKLLH